MKSMHALLFSTLLLIENKAFASPIITIENHSFSNIEIIYSPGSSQKYLFFQIEAYIANRWMLIDENVYCKELNTQNIVSCGPTKVKKVNYIRFGLKDCERIYSFKYEKFDKLTIRLKTVDYYSGSIKYFPSFIVSK